MPEFTLRLRSDATTERPPVAWYLASPNCDDWLHEIAGWNVPHAELQLIATPSSGADRTTAGVLIIAGEMKVNVSPLCIAYAKIGPRLYVPIGAQLEPHLDEHELGGLLSHDYVYVWHPGVGLIAAEETDILRPADLIAQPMQVERLWNRAVPGVAIGERLMALAPVSELSFDQLLDESRDDIGLEGDSLSDLPESPTEPGNSLLDQAGRAIMLGAAGALYSLTKMFPSGAGGATWVNKLREMAGQAMSRVTAAQEHLRNKEIMRLLHLLEHDPDKGLRFALPFNSAGHRGLAPPGNRLPERKIDFNLRRLGGGGPADHWNLDYKTQQLLRAKYRELANREMHLGRFRRAAYIFAELLSDLEAAAMALVNGHHYREAALIYRDRLKRPLDAAKCLENGGLLGEAIEQYEELKHYEKVGDLYTKLGDSDQAAAAYRQAAGSARGDSDFLLAARIWDDKLSDPAQAAVELQAGWPNSVQAIECIRKLFDLYGREGQHAAALRQVQDVERSCPKSMQYVRTAHALSELAAGKYPDVTVREAAIAATQRVVSGRLRAAYRSEAQLLVSSLAKTARHDRLLDRDCRRFVGDVPMSRPAPIASRSALRNVRTIKLGLPGVWRTAAVVGESIVAAGILDHRIVLGRCNFQGERDAFRVPWSDAVARTEESIMLAADPMSSNTLGVYLLGEMPLQIKVFVSDKFPTPLAVGALPGTQRTKGVTRGPHGFVYSVGKSVVVQITNEQGDLIGTQDFSLDKTVDWGEMRIPLVMHARRGHYLYVAIGRFLVALRHGTVEPKKIEFGSTICSLAGSAEHTRPRIVVGLDEGACMLWDPPHGHTAVTFATDMPAPCVGLNRGGYAVAASGSSLEVYDSKERKLTFVDGYNELPAPPIAILTGTRTDQFAIMCENGDVLVFEV